MTYNRRELLPASIDGLLRQTRPLDEIIVVNNGSSDGTGSLINCDYPQVTHLRIEENEGFGKGLVCGLQYAYDRGYEWIWPFNDDDVALPDALQSLMSCLPQIEFGRVGIIGGWSETSDGLVRPEGDTWRRGQPRKVPVSDVPYRVQLIPVFSGGLISRDLLSAAGFPRTDYYLMEEDIEFCLRAGDAGFRIYVAPRPLFLTHLSPSASRYPPWRGYYQTRNQLRLAIDRHCPSDVVWWALRQAKFVTTVYRLDRRADRLMCRIFGAWDAALGKRGKSVHVHRCFDEESSSSEPMVTRD